MHAWHDLDLGERIEQHFRIAEIPKGSEVNYELDKRTGLLAIDRVLASAVHYPANYGFLPRTYCADGDPWMRWCSARSRSCRSRSCVREPSA
jgi:inorganic pyrophosphatase